MDTLIFRDGVTEPKIMHKIFVHTKWFTIPTLNIYLRAHYFIISKKYDEHRKIQTIDTSHRSALAGHRSVQGNIKG
jgi:hypothetical protein